MLKVNSVIDTFSESIFTQMSKLALHHQAVNLAQGFPDFDGPEWIFELAKESFYQNKNQYSPSMGLMNLRQAISEQYKKYYDLNYCPNEEILVTNGATEALYLALTALVNPNDEVILFEPFYDSYIAALELSKTKNTIITLKEPEFKIDFEQLENAMSEKTKLLIFNNPHNPTGKVFSRDELVQLAKIVEKYNVTIISDEVYEFLTYECQHIPTATLANLKNKVVTISSIGKTLSLTGWKIGWAAGPKEIISAMHKLHQFTTFCVATPIQDAVAKTLPKLENYLNVLKADYQKRRDYLSAELIKLKYEVLPARGSYFLLVKVPPNITDMDFSHELILKKKVATIPVSAFYRKSNDGKKFVRFCYAKTQKTLDAALHNLRSN